MSKIHPTAKVHPTVIIEGDVTIGARTVIDPYCYLKGPFEIGEDNHLYPFCVIGTEPEHTSKPPVGSIFIGNKNTLHAYCLVSRGIGDRETRIGDGCFLMDHVHLSHDTVLGDEVTVAHNVVFAGHTRVHSRANIGVNAIFHQFTTVGSYAMVGMGSVVTRDIPPFAMVSGCPSKFMRFNARGVQRAGVEVSELSVLDGALLCSNPAGQAILDAFASDRRDNRKVLSLAAR
ncbi:MAG: DapH/DapD/GlmU-related protein [Deltaproteobacteria bacterium]|nr:DapH/DapD/GlmU-related protein [Deltaproteobacteria bacterium]